MLSFMVKKKYSCSLPGKSSQSHQLVPWTEHPDRPIVVLSSRQHNGFKMNTLLSEKQQLPFKLIDGLLASCGLSWFPLWGLGENVCGCTSLSMFF